MNIRHERPDPALSYLVQAPLMLHTDAQTSHELRGWCPDGFARPEDWPDTPAEATLTIPFQGVYVSFDVSLSEADDLIRFEGLSSRERGVLELFHGAILRGEMSPVEGIIKALDKPVDLVPMTRTETDEKRTKRRPLPRILRMMGATAVYGAAAIFLWGALWSGAWERLNSIRLQAGQIETFHTVGPSKTAMGTGGASPDLVTSGWVDGRHATNIYLGMPARVRLNLQGELFDLPAHVTDVRAEEAPHDPKRPGYVVRLVTDAGGLPEDRRPEAGLLRPGGAASVSLAAPVLPGLQSRLAGLRAEYGRKLCIDLSFLGAGARVVPAATPPLTPPDPLEALDDLPMADAAPRFAPFGARPVPPSVPAAAPLPAHAAHRPLRAEQAKMLQAHYWLASYRTARPAVAAPSRLAAAQDAR